MVGLIFFVGVAIFILYRLGKKGEKIESENKIRNSQMTKTVIREILKSGYIDILVYKTHVLFNYSTEIYFSDYGYENLTLEQTKMLAKEILQALPNKELYTIKEIKDANIRGATIAGLDSIKNALGDYSCNDYQEYASGYRLCNKNYDGRYYKVKNKDTGKYDIWDCQEHKWVQEKKNW